MAKLSEPFAIRSITALNRVMISPMCMYRRKTALQNDFHFVHIGNFAGAGLVRVEATAVEPRGKLEGESL